jgi:hypothetical protein
MRQQTPLMRGRLSGRVSIISIPQPGFLNDQPGLSAVLADRMRQSVQYHWHYLKENFR